MRECRACPEWANHERRAETSKETRVSRERQGEPGETGGRYECQSFSGRCHSESLMSRTAVRLDGCMRGHRASGNKMTTKKPRKKEIHRWRTRARIEWKMQTKMQTPTGRRKRAEAGRLSESTPAGLRSKLAGLVDFENSLIKRHSSSPVSLRERIYQVSSASAGNRGLFVYTVFARWRERTSEGSESDRQANPDKPAKRRNRTVKQLPDLPGFPRRTEVKCGQPTSNWRSDNIVSGLTGRRGNKGD